MADGLDVGLAVKVVDAVEEKVESFLGGLGEEVVD